MTHLGPVSGQRDEQISSEGVGASVSQSWCTAGGGSAIGWRTKSKVGEWQRRRA